MSGAEEAPSQALLLAFMDTVKDPKFATVPTMDAVVACLSMAITLIDATSAPALAVVMADKTWHRMLAAYLSGALDAPATTEPAPKPCPGGN